MKYTPEDLKRKRTPIYSLKAPISLARRESGTTTGQFYRNEFMRDRDRVLYSKSFRRLAGKTQVYLSGVDDHKRTRLTHTLEVSQIARSIAGPLKLDINLIEAIALGHDLGHTPFGHVGERTLHEIMTPSPHHVLGKNCPLNITGKQSGVPDILLPYLGFKHNLQSLKNTMQLEKNYGCHGLDLTNFTLYGIQAHSGGTYKSGRVANHDRLAYYDNFITKGCLLDNGKPAWSLESLVVAEADEIAQRHHDVEDAIRGNLITKDEIISIIQTNFKEFIQPQDRYLLKNSTVLDEETFITAISKIIVNMFVTQLISSSVVNINNFIYSQNITQQTFKNFITEHSPDDTEIRQLISYSKRPEDTRFKERAKSFENTVTDRVLSSYDIQTADAKGKYIVRKIFQAYYATPQQLPNHCVYDFLSEYNPACYTMETMKNTVDNFGIGKLRNDFLNIINQLDSEDIVSRLKLMRTICDQTAGMTDAYAYKTYKDFYE